MSLNIEKFTETNSKIIKHEDGINFEYKDASDYIKVKNGHVYLGKSIVGRSINVQDMLIPFKNSFGESVMNCFDTFASCLTPETSSCSPSKILHQFCSLSIGTSIKYNTIFEENVGGYQPDLIIKIPRLDSIFIEITSDVKRKIEKLNPKYKILIINKYKIMKKGQNSFLDDLIDFSLANDNHDPNFIYNLVKEQAQGNEMLYSSKILGFFMNKVQNIYLHDHVMAAVTAYQIFHSDPKPEFKYEEPSKIIKEELKDLANLTIIDKNNNSYFIFPNNIRNRFVEYENPQSSSDEIEEFESVDGILRMKSLNLSENSVPLFTKEKIMIIHAKAYLNMVTYPADKTQKMKLITETFLKLANFFKSTDKAYLLMCSEKFYKKMGVDPSGLKPQKIHRMNKNYVEAIVLEEKSTSYKDMLCEPESIDPDHKKFLTDSHLSDLIKILEISRDYHELRFKSRVSLAIVINKKPKRCFRINHWKYSNLYAIAKIEGLALEKDKGVVYVSYFFDGCLYRTDKWRLADIENYSVNHHRLVLALAAYKVVTQKTPNKIVLMIYARILSENSWGLSKFLKVYRYLSSGICMSSPSIRGTCKKLVKSIDEPVKSKLSFKFMLHNLIYRANENSIMFGKTPIFSLDFCNLGFESFLVNLCPSNTYGKTSHLETTISELAEEIKLFDVNFRSIKSLYDDFESIALGNQEKLVEKYLNHFKKQDELSKETKGRFTFSPVSILLLKYSLPDLVKNLKFKELTDVCPPLSKLMTAKASTHSDTGESAMAIETIKRTSMKYNLTSTSLLSIAIVSKLRKGKIIDLTMRMFDKDQVGGDREISILTSEYRILQAIAESFFQKIAKFTGVDKLHDPNKINDLFSSYERSTNSPIASYLTADHTRWGPNFNTLIFGLLSLLFCDVTTEYYMPSIISFLSEFKVFEMPCWVTNLFSNSNYCYSIPGMLGRNHMGQGIHHQSSSLYHSMIIMFFKKKILEEFNKNNPNPKEVAMELDPSVTSDDLAAMCYYLLTNKNIFDKSLDIYEKEMEKVSAFFRNILYYFICFGILTSDYKNLVSHVCCEFNQIHLGMKRIASVDLKFVYSLLDPATTGNFYHDFNLIFDNYVNALNCLCNPEVSKLISWMTMIKTCRQWKINPSLIKFPKESLLKAGQPKVINKVKQEVDSDDRYLKFENNLHYKTRKILEELPETKNILQSMINNSIKRMAGTRERTSYRSILTYSKTDFFLLDSPYFKLQGIMGESYSVFMKQMMEDTNHLNLITNNDVQYTFMSYPDEKKNKEEKLIRYLKIRDPIQVDYKTLELVVSHYPKQEFLSSSKDKMILHILRNHKKLIIDKPLFDINKDDIVSALRIVDDKIRDISLLSTACNMILSDGTKKQDEYTRYIYMLPKDFHLIRHYYKFKIAEFSRALPKKDYISPTQKIFYLKGSASRLEQIELMSGNVLTNQRIKEIEIEPLDLTSITIDPIFDLLETEEKFRESFYLNYTTKKKRLIHSDTQSRVTEKEDTMDDLNDILNAGFPAMNIDVNEILNENKSNDKDDEDDSMATMRVARIDFNLDDQIKEDIEIYSIKIENKYGFLCDTTWSLSTIVGYNLILRLENNDVITKMTDNSLNIFKIDKCKYVTFDSSFTEKYKRMMNESITNIKSSIKNISVNDVRRYIYSLVYNEASNEELMDLLCSRIPVVTFTTNPKGKIISSEELLDML